MQGYVELKKIINEIKKNRIELYYSFSFLNEWILNLNLNEIKFNII